MSLKLKEEDVCYQNCKSVNYVRIIHSRFNNVNISTIPYTLPTLTKLDQRYSHIETCQYIWNANQLIGFYVTVALVSSDSKLGFALIHYDIWWNNWNLNMKTWSLIIFGERFSFLYRNVFFTDEDITSVPWQISLWKK